MPFTHKEGELILFSQDIRSDRCGGELFRVVSDIDLLELSKQYFAQKTPIGSFQSWLVDKNWLDAVKYRSVWCKEVFPIIFS